MTPIMSLDIHYTWISTMSLWAWHRNMPKKEYILYTHGKSNNDLSKIVHVTHMKDNACKCTSCESLCLKMEQL